MLLAGDEIGRTQHGNNNAYCQDNELTWVDWELDDARRSAARVRRAAGHRAAARSIRCSAGALLPRPRGAEATTKDIVWLKPDGREMTDEEWDAGLRALPRRLPRGADWPRTTSAASRSTTTIFLLLLNAHHEEIAFVLPGRLRSADDVLRRHRGGAERLEHTSYPATLSACGPLARAACFATRHEALPHTAVRRESSMVSTMRACAFACGRRRPKSSRSADRTAHREPMQRTRWHGWYELTRGAPAPARATATASTASSSCPIRRRASTPTTCTGRAWSSIRGVRLARRRLARPAVARGGDLRAARRHVHARGHVRRRGRAACRLWRRSASPRSS